MAKWTGIGTVRENKSTGKFSLVLAKGVEIYKDGQKIELDKFRSAKLLNSTDSITSLQQQGKIDTEAAEKRLSYIADKNVKYDVVFPPATSEE